MYMLCIALNARTSECLVSAGFGDVCSLARTGIELKRIELGCTVNSRRESEIPRAKTQEHL